MTCLSNCKLVPTSLKGLIETAMSKMVPLTNLAVVVILKINKEKPSMKNLRIKVKTRLTIKEIKIILIEDEDDTTTTKLTLINKS